jgi:hypothetical protein
MGLIAGLRRESRCMPVTRACATLVYRRLWTLQKLDPPFHLVAPGVVFEPGFGQPAACLPRGQ